MTKTYSLIHLNGFIYMIDKEAEIKEGQTGISVNNATYTHYNHLGKKYGVPIIASNDPSLELPLLPVVEDKEKLASDYAKSEYKHSPFISMAERAYMKGYKDCLETKAASKQFTEEDLREAIYETMIYMHLKEVPEDKEATEISTKIIQSLKPKPVAVEIEMEENQCDGCRDNVPIENGIHRVPYPSGSITCTKKRYDNPKILNNIIVINKWI